MSNAVADLALSHGLVSKYTSLVAVEKKLARSPGENMERRAIPVDLPAGWNYAAVFGGRTATPATMQIILGLGALLLGELLIAFRRWFAT